VNREIAWLYKNLPSRRTLLLSLLTVTCTVVSGVGISLLGLNKLPVSPVVSAGRCAESPEAVPLSDQPTDRNWSVSRCNLFRDSAGNLAGSVSIINRANEPRMGVFTLAVNQSGALIAVLGGVASSPVSPDREINISLTGDYRYTSGPYEVEFRCHTS
jgi:hypothetical protein